MKNTIKIAACPFCGSAGEVSTKGDWSGVGCETFVRLGVMCYGHRRALQYGSPDDAISAWNARAALSAAPLSDPTEVAGLGRVTNEENGCLTLQFQTDDAAQEFMHNNLPSIDVRDMPPIPGGSAAPVSGQGASVDTPEFRKLLADLLDNAEYSDERYQKPRDALVQFIDSQITPDARYQAAIKRLEVRKTTCTPDKLSGFAGLPETSGCIDSRPRSEDSRAKVLEEAAQFVSAEVCSCCWSEEAQAFAEVAVDGIRALASTTPPKADNAN